MFDLPDGFSPARAKNTANDLFLRALSSAPVRRIVDRHTLDASELREISTHEERLWTYGAAETIAFGMPECPHGVPETHRRKVGEHTIEEPFVAELEDCELIGPYGLTTTADGEYVLENALRSENLLVRNVGATLRHGIDPRRRGSSLDRRFETAVSMVGPWCRGYFHWFSEWLPRLEGTKHYTEATGREPTLLLPPDPPTWMTESIRLLGYGSDRYVELEATRVGVDRLVVPSIRRAYPADGQSTGYTNSPRGYRWVARRTREALDLGDGGGDDRIYVSRRDARERRVVNEDEVVEALLERGFEVYRLEELAFEEQAHLFADAEAVVGPHGAGLVNAIYGDDLTVVELFGEYENACYFTMAEGLGFKYRCLKCEPVGANMRVDVERLGSLLDDAVEG